MPFLAAVAIVSATGVRHRPGEWYAALAKPSWTPPGWLFGPVWTVLYIMIGVAGWLVWSEAGIGLLFWIWVLQLALNMAWSWIMFRKHRIGWALFDILVLWTTIAGFIVLAWPVSELAAWLFVPYLLWVTFATALNFEIWRLNAA